MKAVGDTISELVSAIRKGVSMSSHRRRAVALIGMAVFVVGILASYGWMRGPAGDVVDEVHGDPNVVEVPIDAQNNVGLAVSKSIRQELESTFTATGIVSPDQTRYAHITPLGRGIVERVFVKLGDRVEKGDPLVGYDNIELGELIGEYLNRLGGLGKLEAGRRVARKILDRAQALLEVDAIAKQQYEVREAEYQQAVASLQSQEAELAQVEEKLHRFGLTDDDISELKSSPHESPHRTSSHSVLRAAFSGIIVRYDVSPGELVDRDERLFTLADTSIVWVMADLYETDIGVVRAGEACRVTVLSYPEEVFTGEVTYISDFLDPSSRTAKVRCVVPNPDRRLKLEMFSSIEIPVKHGREAVTVPIPALQQISGDSVVFVQTDATRFERRVVEIGERGKDWAEVLSGLREEENVVTEGSFYLKSAFLREQIGDEH